MLITFANSLDPDQVAEIFFLKKLILKKLSRGQKRIQNYPVGKDSQMILM